MTTCLDCRRHRPHEARGLCGACYARHRRAGTLARFPVAERSSLFEDWLFLARVGYSRRAAAFRLGVPLKRLEKAIQRGLARGEWVA